MPDDIAVLVACGDGVIAAPMPAQADCVVPPVDDRVVCFEPGHAENEVAHVQGQDGDWQRFPVALDGKGDGGGLRAVVESAVS